MERETTEIKIGKHLFKVKTYATAREVNTIQSTYFAGAKVEIVGQEPKISEFDPSVQFNVALKTAEMMIVEMDGDTTNIVDRVENLPDDDFQELVVELDNIVAKKKK